MIERLQYADKAEKNSMNKAMKMLIFFNCKGRARHPVPNARELIANIDPLREPASILEKSLSVKDLRDPVSEFDL